MASFTDIIPQFNPYVQQMPVEAMVQVGMEKQKRYEENVTKIQSQIDTIAGLAVSRPADRAYLQSKLDQLGNKLTYMAGADFSNFQVANSVSGMTKQIVRDGIVQTSVRATAHAQQQAQKIENGKSDGTWSVENEDLYNSQYQKWYNGKNPGEAFGAEYIPYRDVYKKLRGIAKDVGVDETLVQNLFNEDGTVNKVMIETYSKGKDPNKIYDAFINGLDESDYRQLSITGRYKYKGYDNNQLAEVLTSSNDDYVSAVNARKLDLENKLKEITKLRLTTKKPEEIKQLDDAEAQIKGTMSKLDQGVKSSTDQLNDVKQKLASGDEDFANGIRAKIHTNKFLTSLSKDFADKTSYVKYHENPLWKAIMKEEEFKLDSWWKRANIDIEKGKLAEARRANDLKEKEIKEIASQNIPGFVPGDKIATYQNINAAYNNFTKDRLNNYAVLAKACFDGDAAKMEAYINSRLKQGVSRDDVITELGVQEFTRIAGVINDPAKFGSASKMDRNLITAVQNISHLNGRIGGMREAMANAERNAAAVAGPDVKALADAKSKLTTSTITLPGETKVIGWFTGRGEQKETQVNLTPDDIIDGLTYAKKGWFTGKATDAAAEEAGARLEKKFGSTLGKRIQSYFYFADTDAHTGKSWTTWLRPLAPITAPISEYQQRRDPALRNINNARDLIYSSNYRNFNEALEKEYQNTFSGFFPNNRGFILSDKNRPVVMGKLTAALTGRPEFDQATANMLLENGSQVTLISDPSIMGFGGTSHSVVITGKDGKASTPIALSKEAYTFLTGDQPQEVDIDLELARARINGSQDGSTNSNGLGSWQTAYFSPFNFPNVKKHNIVGGDISKEINNPNSYYLTLYMKTAGYRDPISVPVQGSFSLTEAMSIPSMINDAKINQILK